MLEDALCELDEQLKYAETLSTRATLSADITMDGPGDPSISQNAMRVAMSSVTEALSIGGGYLISVVPRQLALGPLSMLFPSPGFAHQPFRGKERNARGMA